LVEVIHGLAGVGAAGEARRHGDPQIITKAETERATVEQLVVQRAQGKAVVRVVGPAEVEPADMRRLDPNGGRTELAVETAERALPIPRGQHGGGPGTPPLPRHRSEPAGSGSEDRVRIEPDRHQHVRRDGRRKLGLNQLPGSRGSDLRITQGILEP
jgi:hypothetical protein